MNLKGRTVLVAGGAGFIGSHLVDALLARGCRVRVLDNFATGKRENLAHHAGNECLTILEGSITNPADCAAALAGVSLVFHMATLGVRHSIKHPIENHRVNAEGTLLLLEEARRGGVERFLYCSSSEVYGTALTVPMTEDHPTRPHTVYGASKLAGESYARAYFETYDLPTLVIRPFNTFGPRSHHEGDAGEMIPKSIVRALAGQPLLVFGDGTQTRDFTFVTDTAAGLIAAMECDSLVGQTLNIGCNFEITIKDLAAQIVAAVGNVDATVEHIESRPGDVLRLYADASRFQALTGWAPAIEFADGLARTVDYFRNHPIGIDGLLQTETGRNWQ